MNNFLKINTFVSIEISHRIFTKIKIIINRSIHGIVYFRQKHIVNFWEYVLKLKWPQKIFYGSNFHKMGIQNILHAQVNPKNKFNVHRTYSSKNIGKKQKTTAQHCTRNMIRMYKINREYEGRSSQRYNTYNANFFIKEYHQTDHMLKI